MWTVYVLCIIFSVCISFIFFFFSFTPFYLSDFIPFLSLSLLARYIYVHTLYRPDPYAFPSLPIIFFHGFLFNRQSTSRYGLMAMILHSRSTSRGRVIRRQIRSDARVDNFGLGWRRWVVQSTVDNPIKRAAKNIRTNSRMCTRFEFFPRFAIFHFSAEGVLLFFSLSLSFTSSNLSISCSVVSCCPFFPSSLSLFFIRERIFRFLVVVVVVAFYCLLDFWFVGFLGRVKNARKKLNRWVHASDMLQQLIEWWDAVGNEQLWMPDNCYKTWVIIWSDKKGRSCLQGIRELKITFIRKESFVVGEKITICIYTYIETLIRV